MRAGKPSPLVTIALDTVSWWVIHPKKYTEKHKGLMHALELFDKRNENGMTAEEICEITGISKSTLYRAARQRRHQSVSSLSS
jgi:hypothetical protein